MHYASSHLELPGNLRQGQSDPDIYPLSFAQQRLWFLDQFDPYSPAYNVPDAFLITGRLDRDALTASINAIMRRHEALRTIFMNLEGEAAQIVVPQKDRDLPQINLESLAAEHREQEVWRRIHEEARKPFSLSRGPVIRTLLFRLAAEEHILLIVVHHIVYDGWSRGVLLTQVLQHYQALRAHQVLEEEDTPLQYADYVLWQREWLSGVVLHDQLAYWRHALADVPLVLDLPTDLPRPLVPRYQGAHRRFQLDASLLQRLNVLSRQQGCTLYMSLLSAFEILLARHSGQERFLVGTPLANRTRAELEDLIGLFANTLVMRADLSGQPTVAQVLQRVKQTALGAYAHQDLPFEKLVEDMQPARDVSRNPLFQVAFVLENAPLPRLSVDGLTFKPLVISDGTSKFDLTLFVWEDGAELTVVWEYCTDLFTQDTIERMQGQFRHILESMVRDPEQLVSHMQILTAAEHRQILEEWNSTHEPLDPCCLHDLFAARVARHPDAIAVVGQDEQLSYQALDQRANLLAYALRAQGVGPDMLVGLCLSRHPLLLVGMLAILKAGGAYLPLDPTYPPERLRYMLQDAQVAVLLTDTQARATCPLSAGVVCCLDQEWDHLTQGHPAWEAPQSGVTPQHLAYVIYTSGSTGQPKGVQITHHGIVALALAQHRTFDVGPGCHIAQWASWSFDASVFEVVMGLLSGARLVLVTDEQHQPGVELLALLSQEAITHATLVPSALAMLPQTSLPALRALIVAGEACPAELVRAWAPGRTFFNAYGPTETTIWATVQRCEETDAIPGIGRPILNTQVYVLDEQGVPVPVGTVGELYIGGMGLARGYRGRADWTAERFVPHAQGEEGELLYRTGDLVRWRADGTLEFVGRRDQQVKLRGYRIELGEIEQLLEHYPPVRAAVVMVRQAPSGDRRLVAYLACRARGQQGERPGSEEEWWEDQVTQWQGVFNETYSETSEVSESTFNTTGWVSSFSGEPLPASEMREWVDHTVARIMSLQPERILEIGCGTGLLLFQIAPHCVQYIGTDIAQEALDYTRRHLPAHLRSRVTLVEGQANAIAHLISPQVDTVIINSVVQYFPTIDYLVQVLKEMLQIVTPGGALFLGDIRHFRLLEAFHTAVELHKAPPTLAVQELRRRIHHQMAQEKELAIDPAFFLALQDAFPQISSVEVMPKRGRSENELITYRYDVILRIQGPAPRRQEVNWLDWEDDTLSLGTLRQILQKEQPAFLMVRRVPNARLVTSVRSHRLLMASDEEHATKTVGAVQDLLWEEGVHPETLWAMAEEYPYTVELSWLSSSADGSYDVAFASRAHPSEGFPCLGSAAGLHPQPWAAYANDPRQGMLMRNLVPGLRAFLHTRVPQYMVPAHFLVVENMPLSPGGKVNRDGLPDPFALLPEQRSERAAAARNALEEELVRIWTEVLGLDQVGIQDNFFDIGGDSILCIQIVARAARANIPLAPRQIFQYQTIAMLAQALDNRQALLAQQEMIVGAVPLTPIQRWFFAQNHPEPHHWNQAFLLEAQQPLRPKLVEHVVRHLLSHHDALRLRFTETSHGWEQSLSAERETVPFSLFDLHGTAPEEQLKALEKHLQGSLHLTNGPVCQVALFTTGPHGPMYLLWIIHHLVVDGVSWPILLEDFQVAYQQLESGQPIRVPLKTTALKSWSERLTDYAQSDAVLSEISYWQQLAHHRIRPLPVDNPLETTAAYTYASMRALSLSLSEDETKTLLQTTIRTYHTHINAVLLTPLVQAVGAWTGDAALLLHLEGHGREDIFEGIDLSRTVGWFTTLFPVFLDLTGTHGPEEALQRVKEILQQVPAHGFHYGVLRYLSARSERAQPFSNAPVPEICFNYLGQWDQSLGRSSLFKGASIPVGNLASQKNRRCHLLEINSLILDHRLQIEWLYDCRVHHAATIERVAGAYVQALRELLRLSQTSTYAPLVFPEAGLTQDELDALMTELDETLEDE